MNKKRLLTFSFIVLLGTIITHGALAQLTKADSIVQLIKEARLEQGIDSAKIDLAMRLIRNDSLTEENIGKIEAAINQFTKDKDKNKETGFRIRFRILISLSRTDVNKAIDYGLKNIRELESLKDINPDIKNYFLNQLRIPYRNSDRLDEGIKYYASKITEAKAVNDSSILATCYYVMGGFYRTNGLLDQAIYNMQKSISYIDTTDGFWLNNINVLGTYYMNNNEYSKALETFQKVYDISPTGTGRTSLESMVNTYLLLDSLQSIPILLDSVNTNTRNNISDSDALAKVLQLNAWYLIKIGSFDKATVLLDSCWQVIRLNKIPAEPRTGIIAPDYYFALMRMAQKRYPEAIAYLDKNIERVKSSKLELLKNYKLQAELYQQIGDGNKAAEVFAKYIDLQNEVLNEQAKLRRNSFELEQQMNERELSIINLKNENTIAGLTRNFTIGFAILLMLLIAGLYNRYSYKQKHNQVLESTLTSLKATQSQLIQSEKMASLGELTAGIAHEIQNPLNFINNFSEVNTELLTELKDEIDNGNINDVKTIANNAIENQNKINHHGKRADAIVKGMLQHSRNSSGAKEPTDINSLCDEYLRLSYHGLRAKDKSFNAKFENDFDTSLPKVNIVPQDIGRVVLNLINNAFYAVNEKAKQNIAGYEPTVSVITKNEGAKISISVKDNGNGIPEHIKEKIFQPFFTTKPTGQGTGLGLSLSYDIVKAHGGELKVESKEGEGSEFVILIPNTI